jgi:hypothetical protein
VSFSLSERSKVRLYLGWSERFFQFDSRLEQAMNAIDQQVITGDTSGYDLIIAQIAECTTVDTAMDDARNRFKAAKVGSIELQGPIELALLRSQGRQAAGRIASLLGVPILHDVFSGTGPREFASRAGYANGMSNAFPHG